VPIGQVSAQSVPDATVSAQSNRFNTKSAAWLGHKSPPPPPISGKEARTEEAEEKQVKKQAEEAAKEEFKQKVMSDKEVRCCFSVHTPLTHCGSLSSRTTHTRGMFIPPTQRGADGWHCSGSLSSHTTHV